MSNVYSLRLYDEKLIKFTSTTDGLSGLQAEIISVNETQKEVFPLDLKLSGEGIVKWLQNRAFVDEVLKTLGLSANDTKGIIDVCKGLSLNDSYWVVPMILRVNFPNIIFMKAAQGAFNAGNEPYSAYYACQIAEAMGLNCVHYDLENWKGILASKCTNHFSV